MISKEERTKLREECKIYNSFPSSTDFKITRLLDALESAEAREAELLQENEELSDLVEEYQDGKLEMKASAEAAERERNWLAGELADRTVCPHSRWLGRPESQGYIVFNDRADAIASILEWARQSARGEEFVGETNFIMTITLFVVRNVMHRGQLLSRLRQQLGINAPSKTTSASRTPSSRPGSRRRRI